MRILLSAFIILLIGAAPFSAYALKLTPFKTVLVPGRDGDSQVFRIENNSNAPAAVQVSVLSWIITPEGEEKNAEAEDDFVIFPAQLILKAHESRAVRVQWLGDPAPAREMPYRIVAEQIPITLRNTPPAETGLMFMIKFMGALYVGPANPKPDIDVQVEKSSGNRMRVILNNKGSGHALLEHPELTLSGGDGSTIVLNENALKAMAGINLHPGNTRHFDIPIPPDLHFPVSHAHLQYQYGF